MAQEREGVGSYRGIHRKDPAPDPGGGLRYAVQLMGIAEHPYYGSFGYHVSNFFAPSSRFGTPEALQDARAHGSRTGTCGGDGSGARPLREEPQRGDQRARRYGSSILAYRVRRANSPTGTPKLFDYGKEQVRHFLLSNVKYWLDEFHFDGYRFDGVTSMIYHHHGLHRFQPKGTISSTQG